MMDYNAVETAESEAEPPSGFDYSARIAAAQAMMSEQICPKIKAAPSERPRC